LKARKNALAHLSHGGAIGIFSGVMVSTSSKLFSQPADPQWRSFTAKMIIKSNVLVVPIFLMARPADISISQSFKSTIELVCCYVNLSCV